MEKFRERMALEMERQDISQQALANTVGVTRQAINNILYGRSRPSPDVGVRVYRALKLSEDDALLDMGIKQDDPDARRSAREQRILDIYDKLSDEGKSKFESQMGWWEKTFGKKSTKRKVETA